MADEDEDDDDETVAVPDEQANGDG